MFCLIYREFSEKFASGKNYWHFLVLSWPFQSGHELFGWVEVRVTASLLFALWGIREAGREDGLGDDLRRAVVCVNRGWSPGGCLTGFGSVHGMKCAGRFA